MSAIRLLGATLLVLLLGAARVHAQASDPWLGRDKLLHFSLSAGLSGASYALAVPLLDPPWQRALSAAGLTLGLGAGKEVWDALGHGDPSWRDFTWDVLGCTLGVGIALLLDHYARSAPPGAAHAATAAASATVSGGSPGRSGAHSAW